MKLKTKIKNYFFCKKYPFWRQTNVWTGKYLGYSYTWYDDIPEGWQKAFGKQLSDEIKQVGEKYLKEHKGKKWKDILYWEQIKEKWGELCLYASAIEEIMKVLEKYEMMSIGYCILCGKPARYKTKGWVSFLCENCYDRLELNNNIINTYTKEDIEKRKKQDRLTKKDIPQRTSYEYKEVGSIFASTKKQYDKEVAKYEDKESIIIRDEGIDEETKMHTAKILKLVTHKVNLKKEYNIDFNELWDL